VNDRRKALIGKFRASAIERVRRLSGWLVEMEEGTLSGERMQELRRDLHTLKGESTMLGFVPLSEVFHASEGRLARSVAAGPEELRDGGREMRAALSVILRSLERPELDADALAEARDALLRVSPAASAEDPEGRHAAKPAALQAEPPASPVAQAPAPAPAASPKEATLSAENAKREKWVQVQAGRVDDLCERASDFEGNFRALHYKLRELVHSRRGVEAGVRALLPDLERASGTLEEITGSAWALRLVHIEPSIADLVSHAREIAAKQGKQIRVVVKAGDAQIERTVLDVIWEPLLHLVRNAVDHGIEPDAERLGKGEPTLIIEAETVGAHILLSIADNGRGIDVSRLRAAAVARGLLSQAAADEASDARILDLIFIHGFSTRATVSDLSGRGIGLDVVRSSVESLGGGVRVSSEVGVGTQFTLSVPATISKERALVFKVGAALFALPSRTVASVIQLKDGTITRGTDGRSIRLGEETLPLRSLGGALGLEQLQLESWAAIVEVAARRIAFSMDRPLGEIALLRRPVDKVLSVSGAVNGSAILEDGRVVLMLAPTGLLRQSERRALAAEAPVEEVSARKIRVLVVDDSAVVRDLMTQVLELAGFDVSVASGGAQGIAVFLERTPEVVILDVDMPEVDGFEVLRRIRRKDESLPVLMLSMRSSAADQQRALSLGATAYFVKSEFQETTVVDAIRRYAGLS
jgi:two-component system, chemotaxis family, sensor kinase CheA